MRDGHGGRKGPDRRVLVAGLVVFGALVSCGRPQPKEPVLLLTIDTLPASRVGCYGCPHVRTPFLDRLARQGLQVRDAISPAPLTAPSHATMLTGLDPPLHGVRDNSAFRLSADIQSLPELLPDDVRTAAFVSAMPLARTSGLDQGFDIYDADFRVPGTSATERPASEVLDRATAWLESKGSGSRSFTWVHVFDPHYPWQAPAPWDSVALRDGGTRYEAEVAHTDRELGRFLRRVNAADRNRKATLLIVADHGDARGAHGEVTHGLFVYDATLRVPMILVAPDVEPALETSPRPLLDVAPTLLARFDVAEPDAHQGRPLGEPAASAPSYVETCHPKLFYGWSPLHGARDRRWKYVRAPRPELYDLSDDPGETENLHDDHPDVVRSLAAHVDGILAHSVLEEPTVPAGEAVERLQALGYLGSPGVPFLGTDPKDKVDAVSRLFFGFDALSRGQFERAQKLLEEAVRLDPDRKDAHVHLARAHLAAKQPDRAVDEARRALELKPHINETPIRIVLGRALAAAGRPAEALPHLEAALREQPHDERLAATVATLRKMTVPRR